MGPPPSADGVGGDTAEQEAKRSGTKQLRINGIGERLSGAGNPFRVLMSKGSYDCFEPVSYTHLTLPTNSRV